MDNELRPLVNTRGREGEREGERKGERGEKGGREGREREKERERAREGAREGERRRGGGTYPGVSQRSLQNVRGASSVCRDADDVDNLTSRICNQQQRQIPKCI